MQQPRMVTAENEAEWDAGDRAYFIAHPSVAWRVRSPHHDELAHLAATNGAMAAAVRHAVLASQQKQVEVAVFSFNLEPGARVRLVGYEDRDRGLIVVTPGYPPAEETPGSVRQVLCPDLVGPDAASMPPAMDECSVCNRRYRSGSAVVYAPGAESGACIDCAETLIRAGAKSTGASFYISSSDALSLEAGSLPEVVMKDFEKRVRQMRRRLQALRIYV